VCCELYAGCWMHRGPPQPQCVVYRLRATRRRRRPGAGLELLAFFWGFSRFTFHGEAGSKHQASGRAPDAPPR
jgi:hypothetical protein